jgi:hypothetical protein
MRAARIVMHMQQLFPRGNRVPVPQASNELGNWQLISSRRFITEFTQDICHCAALFSQLNQSLLHFEDHWWVASRKRASGIMGKQRGPIETQGLNFSIYFLILLSYFYPFFHLVNYYLIFLFLYSIILFYLLFISSFSSPFFLSLSAYPFISLILFSLSLCYSSFTIFCWGSGKD